MWCQSTDSRDRWSGVNGACGFRNRSGKWKTHFIFSENESYFFDIGGARRATSFDGPPRAEACW
jgi:hypothetical protein